MSRMQILNRGLKGSPKKSKETTKPIGELFQEFEKTNKVHNLSPATFRYYRGCYDRFREFYMGDTIEGINLDVVVDDYTLFLRDRDTVSGTSVVTTGVRSAQTDRNNRRHARRR